MNYITLNQIKSHLHIDPDFTADDNLLTMYGDVAEAVVQRHLCILLSELVDGGGVLPPPIRQAILFYVGNLYNARESVSFGTSPTNIPFTYEYLLDLYKNYSDTTSDEFIENALDRLAQATFLSDTPEEERLAPIGDVAVSTEDRAIQHIAENTTVDEDGFHVTVDRI